MKAVILAGGLSTRISEMPAEYGFKKAIIKISQILARQKNLGRDIHYQSPLLTGTKLVSYIKGEI